MVNPNISARQIRKWFNQCKKLRVFVIGDAMMDQYWHGSIDRISPEAPVPVVQIHEKKRIPGGAANVAMNIRAMGAEVSLLSVLGKDKVGHDLLELLQNGGIDTQHILISKSRKTSAKTRILSRKQQVLRLDEEDSHDLDVSDEHRFLDISLRAIQTETPDIIIFEDYNKGVLTAHVIRTIIQHARLMGCFIAVDPKRTNFFEYLGVDLFKPNKIEVLEALHLDEIIISKAFLRKIDSQLRKKLQHRYSLITLSESGVFVADAATQEVIPAHLRQIADVSGAGDTVISLAALFCKICDNPFISAQIANIAGGLVCENVGVVTVEPGKLLNETIRLLTKNNPET